MKTRNHDWFDMKNPQQPKYGIQVQQDGKWYNAAENGEPCLFDTEAERDAKRAEFRKLKEFA